MFILYTQIQQHRAVRRRGADRPRRPRDSLPRVPRAHGPSTRAHPFHRRAAARDSDRSPHPHPHPPSSPQATSLHTPPAMTTLPFPPVLSPIAAGTRWATPAPPPSLPASRRSRRCGSSTSSTPPGPGGGGGGGRRGCSELNAEAGKGSRGGRAAGQGVGGSGGAALVRSGGR